MEKEIQVLIEKLTGLKNDALSMSKEMRDNGMEHTSEGSDAMYVAYSIALKEISKFHEAVKLAQNEKVVRDEKIKELILEEYKKGNIVIATNEGIEAMPLKDFVKQPVDGILYDLNRNEMVVLAFVNDPKWVNDYAVAQVIRELKTIIDNQAI